MKKTAFLSVIISLIHSAPISSVAREAPRVVETMLHAHSGWPILFDGRGYSVTPEQNAWSWGLELQSYGFSDNAVRLDKRMPEVSREENRLHYDWNADLREWFINDERGLEQGWTLQRRPPGGSPEEPLYLDLRIRGDLAQQVMVDDARYLNPDGQEVLSFNGLKAWDADGVVLAVQFEAVPDQPEVLRIAVAEAGARYPITVDPFVQTAFIKEPVPTQNAHFGSPCIIRGDAMVVGAGSSNTNQGNFHFYRRNGLTWGRVATLVIDHAVDGNGLAYDFDGSTLAFGSAKIIGTNSVITKVAIYSLDGTNVVKRQTLGEDIASTIFGRSVHVSGDTLAVGAYTYGNIQDRGLVYLFKKTATNWVQQAFFDWNLSGYEQGIAPPFYSTLYGNSLAFARGSGQVRTYHRANGVWSFSGELNVPFHKTNEFVFVSFADQDTLLVGSTDQTTGLINGVTCSGDPYNGAVYVYKKQGSRWLQQARLIAPEASCTNIIIYFGSHLEGISGGFIAPVNILSNDIARVWRKTGNNWAQDQILGYPTPFVNSAGDLAQVRFFTDGSQIAFGVGGEDTGATDSGAVYVFTQGDPVNVAAIEAVQSVQDWNNSVPLIAGKRTWVRVHVEAAQADSFLLNAKLHGRTLNGEPLPGSPRQNIPPSANGYVTPGTNANNVRANLESTLNFELPQSWVQGTNVVRVELEFAAGFAGLQVNQEPAEAGGTAGDGELIMRFRRMPTLPIHFVPVLLLENLSVISGRAPRADELARDAMHMQFSFPVNHVHWDVSDVLQFLASRITNELSLLSLLNYIESMMIIGDRPTEDIYYGTFFLNRPMGGLAQSSRNNKSVAASKYDAADPSVFEHEVAHLLGRPHSTSSNFFGYGVSPFFTNYSGILGSCGEISPTDANFPYYITTPLNDTIAALGPTGADVRVHVYGLDLYNRVPIVMTNNMTAELMSYCHTRGYKVWPSKHTYETLIGGLVSRYFDRPFAPLSRRGATLPKSLGDPVAYLVVSGEIDTSDDSTVLNPLLRANRRNPVPLPEPGSYVLELLDANDNLLDSHSFDPDEGTEEPPVVRPFTVAVPDNPLIRKVRVRRNSVNLAELAASSHPPEVTLLSPNGGEYFDGPSFPALWAGADEDGDTLEYSLMYSRDGGETWQALAIRHESESFTILRDYLPGSTNALLRVTASDGFWTVSDTSDSVFTTAPHSPEVIFLMEHPEDTIIQGQLTRFEVVAYDVEDGLLDSSNIVWSSNVDGIIHTGTVADLAIAGLNLGQHQLQVSAVDSEGHSGFVSTSLEVVPFAPSVIDEVGVEGASVVRVTGRSANEHLQVLESTGDFQQWTRVTTTIATNGLFDLTAMATGSAAKVQGYRILSRRLELPLLLNQSSGQVIAAIGGTLQLEVTAESEEPISYQWYFNGLIIGGATSSVFTLPDAQTTNSGTYWVEVSNVGGPLLSDPIDVLVQYIPPNDNFAAPMVITGFPATVELDSTNGSMEPGEPLPSASALAGASIWFTWIAPSNTPVIIQTCESEFNAVLAVWTGEALDSLTELVSNDEGSSCDFDGSRVEFNATSGTTYRIVVYGANDQEDGLIVMSMYDADPPPPPPSNDNFADAITIEGFSTFSKSNNLATLEVDEPLPDSELTLGASVWYTWTAPTSGLVRVNTCSIPFGFDSVLAVWTGATLQTLGLVGYNDDFCVARSQFDFVAVSGTVYRFAIYGKNGGEGLFDLVLQKLPDPPPNDAFATPMIISTFPSTNLATNAGATIEPGDPFDGFSASVWFQWTSPVTTNVTVQTCGSFFTTNVKIFTGDTLDALTLVANNSPSCSNRSVLNFAATNGVTYRIGVARIGTSTQSSITLTIREQ